MENDHCVTCGSVLTWMDYPRQCTPCFRKFGNPPGKEAVPLVDRAN